MAPPKFKHIFEPRYASMNMTLTRSCGTVCLRDTLNVPELNHMAEVRTLVEGSVSQRFMPSVMFYDSGCRLAQAVGDSWPHTKIFVDKFHMAGHSLHDSNCQTNHNPNVFHPHLYRKASDGSDVFLWNSSMAEVTNSWLTGLSGHVKTSCVAWHDAWLNHLCLAHNELTMSRQSKEGANNQHPQWYKDSRSGELL